MMLYHQTQKGQLPKVSQAMFQPVIGKELAELKSAGRQYQITSRKENGVNNTVEIVAQYDPSN